MKKQVEDGDADLTKSKDVVEVGEVLRVFFLELLDPLFPNKFYDPLMAIASMLKFTI